LRHKILRGFNPSREWRLAAPDSTRAAVIISGTDEYALSSGFPGMNMRIHLPGPG
jgi:hypothetical protein